MNDINVQHHKEVDVLPLLTVGQNIVNKILVDDAVWELSMVVPPQRSQGFTQDDTQSHRNCVCRRNINMHEQAYGTHFDLKLFHDRTQFSSLKIAFSHETDCHGFVLNSVSTYIVNRLALYKADSSSITFLSIFTI